MSCRFPAFASRPLTGLGAIFGLALMLAPAPGVAQQYTQEQRAACEGDAMRLCGQLAPDIQRITACMHQKRRYLSPRCRAVFIRR